MKERILNIDEKTSYIEIEKIKNEIELVEDSKERELYNFLLQMQMEKVLKKSNKEIIDNVELPEKQASALEDTRDLTIVDQPAVEEKTVEHVIEEKKSGKFSNKMKIRLFAGALALVAAGSIIFFTTKDSSLANDYSIVDTIDYDGHYLDFVSINDEHFEGATKEEILDDMSLMGSEEAICYLSDYNTYNHEKILNKDYGVVDPKKGMMLDYLPEGTKYVFISQGVNAGNYNDLLTTDCRCIDESGNTFMNILFTGSTNKEELKEYYENVTSDKHNDVTKVGNTIVYRLPRTPNDETLENSIMFAVESLYFIHNEFTYCIYSVDEQELMSLSNVFTQNRFCDKNNMFKSICGESYTK